MRIARLAAALAAAGVLVLAGATPSLAEAEPSINPGTVKPGDTYTAMLTDCAADAATVTAPDGEEHALTAEGTNWAVELTVPEDTKPGDYKLAFTCGTEAAGPATLTVLGDEEPEINFVADINPKVFRPGDKLTVTTTGCPTKPIVEDVDGLFTGPLVLKEVGRRKHAGTATTKADLPDGKTFHLIVSCEGAKPWVFVAQPGKPIVKKPGKQTGVTPVGGVDTGDGSTAQRGGGSPVLPTIVGGSAVLAAAFGLAYWRRRAREDA